MIINDYSNLMLVNNITALNKSIYKANKSLNELTKIKGFNGVGSAINDIKMSKIESEARGTIQGNKNIQDGVSLIDTATNSLDKASSIGEKIRELAIKYQNDILSSDEKVAIQEEAKLYYEELADTISNTRFNNHKVFDKDKYYIQTGAYADDNYTIKLDKISKINDTIDKIEDVLDKPIIKPPTDNEGGNGSGTPSVPGCGDGNNNSGNGGGITKPGDGGSIGDGGSVGDGDNSDNFRYIKAFKNGNILFEGWVDSNNTPQKYGSIYDEKTGIKLYEGEMSNGKANGNGTLFGKNTVILYKGQFKNGMKDGFGEEFDVTGEILYRGNFKEDKYSGEGISFNKGDFSKEGIYENGIIVTIKPNDIDKSSSPTIEHDYEQYKSEDIEYVHINNKDSKIMTINSDIETSNEDLNMEDLLNLDFIDNELLSPLKAQSHSLNVQSDILERRFDTNTNKVDIYGQYVTVKGTDQYIETLNQLKEDTTMAQLVSSLYAQNLDTKRELILNLLR